MIDYGKVRGAVRPNEIEMTNTKVFVASNIVPFEQSFGEESISGYEYDYKEYTKDEYIQLLNDTIGGGIIYDFIRISEKIAAFD